jgi:hypothetical protein
MRYVQTTWLKQEQFVLSYLMTYFTYACTVVRQFQNKQTIFNMAVCVAVIGKDVSFVPGNFVAMLLTP